MATYTEHYNLKMPSGQDAPDVEVFNGNTEIIDKALDAHANNFADKYDPDSTYTQGKLCIQNDALWKAKQNIDVPEPWTESHWESTTLAAELSSLNSSFESGVKIKNVIVVTRNITINSDYNGWELLPYTFPMPLSDVYAGLTGVNPASGKTAQFFVNPSGNLVCTTAMTNEYYGSWSISGAYVGES